MFLNLDIPFIVVGLRISGLLGAEPPPRCANGRALTGDDATSVDFMSTSSTLGVGTALVDWVDGGVGAARDVCVVLDEAASDRPNEVLAREQLPVSSCAEEHDDPISSLIINTHLTRKFAMIVRCKLTLDCLALACKSCSLFNMTVIIRVFCSRKPTAMS